MAKEMLINVSAGEECRIALLDNGKLDELYMERTSSTCHVGNIYKGRVTNVEPSIQAAFVDVGIGRNGFLHISDLMPSYFGKKASDVHEPVGRKLGRRDRPPIQQCLKKGDEIVVQIIKEGIGTKGPTLSTYLSIPGRVLVMMPGMSKMGISKKLDDEQERARLRTILDALKPPKDCGFIIRTAGIGKTKAEIERDLKYLTRLWEQLKKKIEKEKAPVELYTEGDLVTRTVRDVFSGDIEKIIVDDKETAKKVKDFIKLAMPRTKNKVELYEQTLPLFHKYDIEEEIEKIYSRKVPLPSGGYLIIDQTEAIVAIDVNSGKFRDHADAETTAFKTDLEAADEIPRQLKLRDMGGVIICDFIDLRFERHRRELEQRLYENLKKDRAKTRMLRMSQFGIIEMTRQRMRPSLKKSIYQECRACRAHGMVKTPESMSLDVMRKLRIAAADQAVVRVLITVHPDVAAYMLNRKRAEIAKLEAETRKRVTITSDAQLPMDEVKFELYDARDGYIYIAELGMAFPTMPQSQSKGSGRGKDHQSARNRQESRKEESESLDAEDLFTDEDEKKPLTPKPVPTATGALEQTGDEDEATVVDIDEGGADLPGRAPESFYDPSDRDNRYRDRHQGQKRNRSTNGHRRDESLARHANGKPDADQSSQNRSSDSENQSNSAQDNGETGGRRRRRRRRGRRGRGQNGGENNARNHETQSLPSVPNLSLADYEYDEEDPDRPAPGNELAEHNTPQAQLQRRNLMTANPKNASRGRRGRRGRGRSQNDQPQRPAFDRTGLPDDEELEREAAELEARQAQLAAEASTAQLIDEIPKSDSANQPEPAETDLTTPPPQAAPEIMDDASEDNPKQSAGKPTRSKRASSSAKRVPPPQPDVVRTGSVDKHLADDEPIAHEPISRPISFIDLDALPDYDE
ncbi:MAG: hypothetical protein KatS3mg104_0859 [Phycisphaerae bacterium]|jgi:ribonuclease E|nr:MAG: hypothetical protein KatS3mg104_0859 [Phycisphaerae bacterium]